jgi:hypothetical protein
MQKRFAVKPPRLRVARRLNVLYTSDKRKIRRKGACDMSRAGNIMLDTGDRFPLMEFDTVESGRLVLPDNLFKHWNVVLFYRGHW